MTTLRPILLPVLLLATVSTASACNDEPTGPTLGEADLRVLFIGNSLTYTNGLPGLVETVAEAAGISIETAMSAHPNFGLGDHWGAGAPALIRDLRPDIVVLQQGPSTLASSQAYLREWTDSLARVAREVDAVPALFMVWPPDDPQYSFGAVLASYRAAAVDVDGAFIPAGVAWLESWKGDPQLRLYGLDGFHPSQLGSIVAALTIVGTLTDAGLASLPATMQPSGGGPTITLTPAERAVILPAVERAVAGHGIR